METLILEIGSSLPIWDLEPKLWKPLITPCWIKHTWESLHATNMKLVDTVTRPTIPRHNDMFLMDAFVLAGYHGQALFRLNWI